MLAESRCKMCISFEIRTWLRSDLEKTKKIWNRENNDEQYIKFALDDHEITHSIC